MNYILIQNDGEIEINSFELIGASTKRDQSGKIGFFGSGLKYSIAYMIRNNISFRIFSGENEISISTVKESLRDQSFDRICINGNPTSYTTTMGPTWTEDWFVLREIYCNALDESGCTIIRNTPIEPCGSKNKTRIYIERTLNLQTVCDNFDNYFSEDRTPLYIIEDVYTSGMGIKDGLKHPLKQTLKVYTRTSGVVYRRGINIGGITNIYFDYEVNHCNINEDRTGSNIGSFEYAFVDIFFRFLNEEFIIRILNTYKTEKKSWEYNCLAGNSPNEIPSEKWVKFSQENTLVIEEIAGKFESILNSTKQNVYFIPSTLARHIRKHHEGFKCLGCGGFTGDVFFEPVEPSEKQKYMLKNVLESLKEMKYNISYDIYIVDFERDSIYGYANNNKIYIASKAFDTGKRKLAMVLIEENEHLISGFSDKTREFQNHIFSIFLQCMEEQNGLFL